MSGWEPQLRFDLGEDIEVLRSSVARLGKEHIAPLAEQIDRENTFPRALWPKLGALGLHGITVPEERGGAGLGYLAHCVVMEEISRFSASVGLSYGAHSNLCVNQLQRNGSAETCLEGTHSTWQCRKRAAKRCPAQAEHAPDQLCLREEGKDDQIIRENSDAPVKRHPEQKAEEKPAVCQYT